MSQGRERRLEDRTYGALLADRAFLVTDRRPHVDRLVNDLAAHGVEIVFVADADSVLAVLDRLHGQGVGPGLVAVVSRFTPPTVPRLTHVRGDAQVFCAVVSAQLQRHRDGRVPDVDRDPRWTIVFDDLPATRLRVTEALLTLADGRIGTRGDTGTGVPGSDPGVRAAGLYTGEGRKVRYADAPLWTDLPFVTPSGGEIRQILDLRTGVLVAEHGEVRSLRMSSIARPGCSALRAEGPAASFTRRDSLQAVGEETPDSGTAGGATWMSVRGRVGGITAAAKTRVSSREARTTCERLAAYAVDPNRAPGPDDAVERLTGAAQTGFARLLTEHRAAWAGRWQEAEISIEGDPASELAVRFALFHLLATVTDSGEAGVAARGLSGPAYAGHVFWDADVYALPVLAAVRPRAAEAMLAYRINRLPAAREIAADHGHAGARFPWESADSGEDVTPRVADTLDGAERTILTGEHEEHITADIAWAASHYAAWTGDRAFLTGRGRGLLVETAAYWASRIELDADGTAHVRDVIGPDEYHERVNDNAFTNVMVRWHLRRAGALVKEPTCRLWHDIADRLVDGFDTVSGRYEQFDGFWDLEPLVIGDVATPPVAADVLLGPDRIQETQIIKQADVLMLHHLLPDSVEPGSLTPNLDAYLPVTAHGSSLSPAIHASLLARAGRVREALDLFRLAGQIDLDDLTGTTAGGLHLATMSGLWQALVYGFLGVWPTHDVLHLDPHLPDEWEMVSVKFRFHGRPVSLCVTHTGIDMSVDGRARVAVRGRDPAMTAGRTTFRLSDAEWKEA